MLPRIILVNEDGPEEGADIHEHFVVVKEKNLNQLLTGYDNFFPELSRIIIYATIKEFKKEVKEKTWFEFMDKAKKNGVSPTMQEEIDRGKK